MEVPRAPISGARNTTGRSRTCSRDGLDRVESPTRFDCGSRPAEGTLGGHGAENPEAYEALPEGSLLPRAGHRGGRPRGEGVSLFAEAPWRGRTRTPRGCPHRAGAPRVAGAVNVVMRKARRRSVAARPRRKSERPSLISDPGSVLARAASLRTAIFLRLGLDAHGAGVSGARQRPRGCFSGEALAPGSRCSTGPAAEPMKGRRH